MELGIGGRCMGIGGVIGLLAQAGLTISCLAEQPDKSQFNLFNPTPGELMREFRTDRPDKTESPYTVDAGHFQVEVDELRYTYDRYNGLPGDVSGEAVGIGPVNLNVVRLDNLDFQLVIQ